MYAPLYDRDIKVKQTDNKEKGQKVIEIPLRYFIICWRHSLLRHVDETQFYSTVNSHIWFPKMEDKIAQYVKSCTHYQRHNNHDYTFGHKSPRDISQLNSCDDVSIDVIGLWRITIYTFECSFRAYSYIDAVISNLTWNNSSGQCHPQ